VNTITSVIDVIRALSNLIEKEYPNYPIVDYDVDEDYPRPCYFIETESVKTQWVAVDYLEELSDLQIVFFAEDRYDGFLELLEMKNHLTQLFNEPLELDNGYFVSLLETTSELFKGDKVLEFSFQVSIVNQIERNETDYLMEELDYHKEVH
jgi:hypothetical protein